VVCTVPAEGPLLTLYVYSEGVRLLALPTSIQGPSSADGFHSSGARVRSSTDPLIELVQFQSKRGTSSTPCVSISDAGGGLANPMPSYRTFNHSMSIVYVV
jgi:hypothetical protein